MNFDQIAKDLLRPPNQPAKKAEVKGGTLARANALAELADAGFGRAEIFNELRLLYDGAEDDSLKKQILDIVIKMHGLYKEDESRNVPTIVFNINGNRERVNSMLCPPSLNLLPKADEIIQ